MLGSADEMKRLAGYYALLETDSIDVEFLVERYGMESSTVNRRTIVWLLGFARNSRAAFDACADCTVMRRPPFAPKFFQASGNSTGNDT